MKIAITYENGNIFGHFGHTAQFKVYEIEENKVISSKVIDTNGSGHGALAGMLSALDVDVLICGGSLNYDPEAKCVHHDHEHGESHPCGEHGCGGNCHVHN